MRCSDSRASFLPRASSRTPTYHHVLHGGAQPRVPLRGCRRANRAHTRRAPCTSRAYPPVVLCLQRRLVRRTVQMPRPVLADVFVGRLARRDRRGHPRLDQADEALAAARRGDARLLSGMRASAGRERPGGRTVSTLPPSPHTPVARSGAAATEHAEE